MKNSFLEKNKQKQGIARAKLNIYNQDNILVAKTLSEEDGYFSYLGLMPGNYYVLADEEQLKKIKMTANNPKTGFTIKAKNDGDIADGIEIMLSDRE